MLESPGAVLYSSAATLEKGQIYLLGLNPGGDGGSTLQDSINASRANHNAYLDEQWSPGGHLQPKGQATLQRRVQKLCTSMGFETRDVPASNLVFTRSTRLHTHLDYDAALRLCMPVHEVFLRAIQPRFVMTFGSLGNFSSAFQLGNLESKRAEHGNWNANRGDLYFDGEKIAFGNVPHMSLWASDKRSDVVSWATAGLKKTDRI